MKVFCVGFNKTGTTSLEAFLRGLGLSLGDQHAGEMLLDDVLAKRIDGVLELSRTADAFQDIPFSLPGTFRYLAREFPDAKFILTVRDDPDEWYRSMTRFHAKMLGVDGVPSAEQMAAATYCQPRWLLRAVMSICDTTELAPYDYPAAVSSYARHVYAVQDYFRGDPRRLLTVNLAHPESSRRIVEFLGMTYEGQVVPRLNANPRASGDVPGGVHHGHG